MEPVAGEKYLCLCKGWWWYLQRTSIWVLWRLLQQNGHWMIRPDRTWFLC